MAKHDDESSFGDIGVVSAESAIVETAYLEGKSPCWKED
jgi:hypothetical protein